MYRRYFKKKQYYGYFYGYKALTNQNSAKQRKKRNASFNAKRDENLITTKIHAFEQRILIMLFIVTLIQVEKHKGDQKNRKAL